MGRKRYEIGSGNVFKDLGIPNAEEHLVKAHLVFKINAIMKDRGLMQAEAGDLLGITQPDVSKMLRGDFKQFSVERLLRFLVALNQDVEIVVKPHRGEAIRRLFMSPEAGDRDKMTMGKSIAKALTGNVFRQLGFSLDESVGLKMRAELHSSIVEVVKRRDYSRAQLAEMFETDQSRINNLMRGKIDNFKLETLVRYAETLGMNPRA